MYVCMYVAGACRLPHKQNQTRICCVFVYIVSRSLSLSIYIFIHTVSHSLFAWEVGDGVGWAIYLQHVQACKHGHLRTAFAQLLCIVGYILTDLSHQAVASLTVKNAQTSSNNVRLAQLSTPDWHSLGWVCPCDDASTSGRSRCHCQLNPP